MFEKQIDKIVNSIIEKRKIEITLAIDKELDDFKARQKEIFEAKKKEIKDIVLETDGIKEKVLIERNKVSQTLDILRQNLTAEEIWLKLWSVAFDKAMDICWDLTKDKTKEIMALVEDKAYTKSKQEMQEIINKRDAEVEEKLKSLDINKQAILNAKEEANKFYLIYDRNKDQMKKQYYKGQVDLIGRFLNEKTDT
jgi:hypothetical protein